MLTTEETQAAQSFWNWFEQNHLPYEFFENMTQEQMDDHLSQLLDLLDEVSDGLDVQFGRNMVKDGPAFRLVITTAGNISHFAKAKALAALAPDIPNWQVYALIPPLREGVKIRLTIETGNLDPNEIWFLPMEVTEQPGLFGVHIALRPFDYYESRDRLEELNEIVIQMVVTIIGEESWAMDIQHLELGPMPDNPMEKGFMNLYDLPAHISELRQKWPSPNKLED